MENRSFYLLSLLVWGFVIPATGLMLMDGLTGDAVTWKSGLSAFFRCVPLLLMFGLPYAHECARRRQPDRRGHVPLIAGQRAR